MKRNIFIKVTGAVGVLFFAWTSAVYGQTEGTSASSRGRYQDPAASRSVWTPTALPKPRKGVQATGFNLGLWHVEGTINNNIDVGSFVLLPIGLLAVAPTVRYHRSTSENFHYAFVGNAGFATSFASGFDANLFMYGGGPVVTLGTSEKYLNFALLGYGFHAAAGNELFDVDHSAYMVLPSIGGGIQVAGKVKLNAEFISFNGSDFSRDAGAIWAFVYGARIFSESGSIFGDISFVAPIASGVGDFYRTLPLGFPMLTLGFSF